MRHNKTHHKPVIMLDFGGVYFTEGVPIAIEKISKKYKVSQSKVHELLYGYHEWQEYKRGKLTRKEFWKTASKHLVISRKNLKDIEKIWHSSYVPHKGMPQLVRRLRKHYRVVILSGNIPERVKYLDKKYKMLKDFHDHHFSFNYGVTKSDSAKLFLKAVRKMHLQPEDCIVVDDKKEFLDEVEKAGGKTILFKNAKQLERELRKYGVKI